MRWSIPMIEFNILSSWLFCSRYVLVYQLPVCAPFEKLEKYQLKVAISLKKKLGIQPYNRSLLHSTFFYKKSGKKLHDLVE